MNDSSYLVYARFPNEIADRLTYGDNHPARKAFYDTLKNAQREGFELRQMDSLAELIEDDVTPGKEYPDKMILYLGLENIASNTGKAVFNSCFGKDIHSTAKRFHRGNIVFSGLRPYLNKVHLVEVEEALGSAELFVILPNQEQVSPEFLFRYLLSDLVLSQTKWILTGSSYPRLDIEDFKRLLVILPTNKAEQAAILEQMQSLEHEAAELEERVNKTVSVASNRLLERLGILGVIPSVDFDYYSRSTEGLGRMDFEFNNPKYDIINTVISKSQREFVELRDVVYFLQDSDNPTERPDADFLYADIGTLDTKWGELNAVIMKGRNATSSRMRRVMYEGNVLVSTTRPTRNAIALVPKELDKQICSTGFAVLKCKPTMNNRFLFHALRTWLSNFQFAKYCSGSGYPAINQEIDLPHIRVPMLPDIDDQVKIADEVDDLLSKARKIEGESKNKHEAANAMFDKAVTGFLG